MKKLSNKLSYYQSTILHAPYDSLSQTWQFINKYIHVAIMHSTEGVICLVPRLPPTA